MQTIPLPQNIKDEFQTFEALLNGSKEPPLHAIRTQAWGQLQELGIPGPKSEDYRNTPIGKKLSNTVSTNTKTESYWNEKTIKNSKGPNIKGYKIILINGRFDPDLSDAIPGDIGVEITPLNTALGSNQEWVEDFNKRFKGHGNEPFVLLNNAFLKNGYCLKIKEGAQIKDPFLIYHFTDEGGGSAVENCKNFIHAGASSKCAVFTFHYHHGAGNTLINYGEDIIVEANAHLDFLKIQDQTEELFSVDNTRVLQEKDSRFTIFTLSSHGSMIRNNLHIGLNDSGIESNMYGLYLLDGQAHVDHHTIVDHRMPHSVSNELYKGVIDDAAHGVFNGKIFVRKDAQKTNAFQSNKNILLSDDAVINTKPQLEIWADDVKCSHGCTTGQLDEEAQFYLQTRGLSKKSARAMLLFAFAVDVLEHISNTEVKSYLTEIIQKRLNPS